MKNLKITLGLLAVALCGTFTSVSAQVAFSGGADFVSSYVWRGAMGARASVQPYAEASAGNFAVGTWGSTDINGENSEVDFYASYGVGNFSATVTNYWWEGEDVRYFGGKTHYLEVALGYTICESFPLSLSVNTMVYGGADDLNAKGDQAYSTYIELGYPVLTGDVALDVAVGFTPADGMYADEFDVCNIAARLSKSIAVTDSFELPLFVDTILNPAANRAYLVFGTSLCF